MPSANAYNANIARALHGVNQKHLNVENAINDNPMPVDITSQLEGMTLKNPDIVGGSGVAASTIQDLGFEPTLRATGEGKPKNAKRKMNVAIVHPVAPAATGFQVVFHSITAAWATPVSQPFSFTVL